MRRKTISLAGQETPGQLDQGEPSQPTTELIKRWLCPSWRPKGFGLFVASDHVQSQGWVDKHIPQDIGDTEPEL